MKRAHDRDPLAPIVNDHLGLSYALAGRHEEAMQKIQAAIEIDPSLRLAHYRRGWVYLQKAQPENALGPLERAVELSDGKNGLGLLALANGLAGRQDEARRVLGMLDEKALSRYCSPLELSLAWAGLGDADRTFAQLERAVEDRVSDLVLFLSYPWPAAIREDSRFQGVADQVGLD